MTQRFTIRAATPADLAQIDVLLGRSYPALLKGAYPPSLLVTVIPLISKAQPHLVASGTYFVVLDGPDIVGAGGWTKAVPGRRDGQKTGIGHIRHVVTDHRRVREGIGAGLMAHIFATAQAAGVQRLECLSTLMAEPFYAAVGFESLGPMSLELRRGIAFPVIQMWRDF